MGKPIKSIHLDGPSVAMFTKVEEDKNPNVITWNTDISGIETQNVHIFVEDENGELIPKYQTGANGVEGFPIRFNSKKEPNGIFLNPGDRCRLLFRWTNTFTQVFTLPTKGN